MALFKSILGKVRQGLEKTRQSFMTGVHGLRSLLTGRRLDD